ncbi:MAG: hypothetical protein CM1200mP9_11160 [Gammaproteobacteria bacterium]|nr:MAG: hypothetical protein CM1200mP9_11160 [Gammaproteobacteria bacterium]
MSRLQPLALDQLTEGQLAVLNAINGGPRGGGAPIGLVGPFGVWVRAPRVGMAIQALGGAARFDTAIAEDVKEVPFVWSVHTTRQSLSLPRTKVLPGPPESTLLRLMTFGGPGPRIYTAPSRLRGQ